MPRPKGRDARFFAGVTNYSALIWNPNETPRDISLLEAHVLGMEGFVNLMTNHGQLTFVFSDVEFPSLDELPRKKTELPPEGRGGSVS